MRKVQIACLVAVIALSSRSFGQNNATQAQAPANAPFRNPALPIDQRVKDLVSRMTLEEKVSQMVHTAAAVPRLGIPEYNWWSEGLHGVGREGFATVFPQAIGVAATFDPDLLRGAALAATEASDLLICEGVGGFLVPLGNDYLVRDLARDLGMPVLIVASPGLGTINHTLLTVEAVRAAGLEVQKVVLNPWPDEPSQLELSNLETISIQGQVEVETLPRLDLPWPGSWPALSLSEPERRLRAA